VPSTGARHNSASGLSAGNSGAGTVLDAAGNPTAVDPVTGAPVGGGVAGGGGGGGTGGTGTGGSTVPGQPPGVPAGDTSHCVKGRQFDPAIAYWAPPCVPGTPGAAFANNGGNTYRGVSGKEIVIVDYVTNYGAQVNAILKAQGNLLEYDDAKTIDKAYENFINSHFQLYGRKLKIITYQGQCTSVPPDKKCLLPEMDTIVRTYKPFAVFWSTTLCSECFAKLAQQQVISFGGIGFSDRFANDNAPYFYNAGMSSTKVQQLFAEWWCNQMSSVNVPSRVAKYAGTQNPAQNFNGQKRVLGVISTNDPDNQGTVENVLFKELERRCGEKVTHFYYYEQNINTAATQVQAGIAAMDTTSNPATTVLCLCDSVAPSFVYKGEQDNEYYPENVLADVQNMGYDNVAQAYGASQSGGPSLGCPKPSRGCPFDNAIGVVDAPVTRPAGQLEGVTIFKQGSNGAALPAAVTPFTVTNLARNWIMMANLIQNTGPALTPPNMAARAQLLGSVGGGEQPTLSFPKGSWNWVQDVKLVYWNKAQPSPYNALKGKYFSVGGTRYGGASRFPSMPNGPDMPLVPERT
jgi:hypothetical protein